MFACLELREPRTLRERRRPVPPTLARVECPGGAPFFRMEAVCRKGRPDWAAIEHTAGRLRTKILAAQGVTLPQLPPRSQARMYMEPGLRAFVPRRLPMLLQLRLAQQVLRLSHIPPKQRCITLVDAKGSLCRCMEPFIPLAGNLRVFTLDLPAWRSTALQLQSRYGAALVLSDSPGCFAHCDLVIADDLSRFTGSESGLIFTPDPQPLPGCRVVRCGSPLLPEPYAKLCPPHIDPLQFASALYELCGVKEMERLRFGSCAFDGVSEAYSPAGLARILDGGSNQAQPPRKHTACIIS